MRHSRIVAIDYGTKRVGIARSDPMGWFAQPVGTYSPPEALKVLRRLHEEEGIRQILIGWPLTLEGREEEATQRVEAYIKRIQKILPDVPILRWDERFTSEVARELLLQAGHPRKKRREKGRIDAAAAALMLQEFLNSHPAG